MDKLNERVVKAKADSSAVLSVAGSIFVILMGLFLTVTVTPFSLLVVVIGSYLLAYVKDGLKLEYEYTLTNGDIDVAKILDKKRRKEIRSISADSITYMNYADSERVRNDLEVKKGQVLIRDYSGVAEDGKLVAIYSSDGNRDSIDIFSFDEKCLNHMKDVLKMKSAIK